MATTASCFVQVLSLVDRNAFVRAVRRHDAERGTKGFSCWGQFVSMLFCQMGAANSLCEPRLVAQSALSSPGLFCPAQTATGAAVVASSGEILARHTGPALSASASPGPSRSRSRRSPSPAPRPAHPPPLTTRPPRATLAAPPGPGHSGAREALRACRP